MALSAAERRKQWVQRNPEKAKEAYRKWAAKSAEYLKAREVARYARDREKILAARAAWYATNADDARARSAAYRAANPEKVKATKAANPEGRRAHDAARRARKRGAEGSYTKADVRRLFDLQRGRCPACRVKLNTNFHVDHITALASGGANSPSNLQVLCPPCNLRKHARDPVEFMQNQGFLL